MSQHNPFELMNRRILVTGATSGIGYAIALACARMGAEIIGVGRNVDRLSKVQFDLSELSSKPHMMISADLTNSLDRDSLVANIDLPLNGVVFCAGISRLSPVRMITEAHLSELYGTNVDAPMLLTQALLKKNLISYGGSLLYIASIAAHIGVPGVSAYSGTKAALLAMVRCLALEVVKRGIRANCISPALVETPLFKATAEIVSSIDAEKKHYPLGFGQPEDVANGAIYLLSDASKWITGTTIVMDGGLTIR
jgi:NAD(P)-dependent dehydrogenase (short-subunit alcohol dehydrogenase family)